eukprot:6277147-Alexandrium_andersonii.AAC.1
MHADELCSKDSLVVANRWLKSVGACWTYFSALSKMAQLWRESGKVVFFTWENLYGASAALRNAKRLPSP